VAEQWIRDDAHAVEVDEDGRMAEESQPIAQLASSDMKATPPSRAL
jgi:hypothetical protein